MATYTITERDKIILHQPVMNVKAKFDIYNFDGDYLDSIEGGVVSGNPSINADSDVRRTLSLTIVPDVRSTEKLQQDGLIWFNRKVKYYIGLQDIRSADYVWYPQGVYIFMSTSLTYDSTTNQLTIECSDMTANLDGTRNGVLPQQTILYPAYTDYMQTTWLSEAKADGVDITSKSAFLTWCKSGSDSYNNILVNASDEITTAAFDLMTNGETLTDAQIEADLNIIRTLIPTNLAFDTFRTVIDNTATVVNSIRQHYTIREAMLNAISQLGYVDYKNAELDFIGEAKGMPGYAKNWDYDLYRKNNPSWQYIPYDQEFSSGTTVQDVVTTLRDLYENYETFFDIYGNFCCKLIPSGDDDYITFDNDFLQDILISENTSLDFSTVRNITQVYGEVLEPDFFAYENVTYSNNTLVATVNGYTDEYCNGDLIAITSPADCSAGFYLNINSFGKVQVYDVNYECPIDTYLASGDTPSVRAGYTYVFKIYKTYNRTKSANELKAYYLGEYQPNAMEVLTDGTVGDNYTTTNGVTVKKYSKEFFEEVYQCPHVYMLVNPDSPFTIQKIGCVLQVLDNESVDSSSIALETAHQENYRVCRLTDNITITTKLCPFADVNQKVEYQPSDRDKPLEYIVKSLSHDLQGGTTSWTLMRYYRLYLLPDELLEPSDEYDYYFKK